MPRFQPAYEVTIAEQAMQRLLPRVKAQEGVMRGINDLSFDAGPDYRGDPSITFTVEFADAPTEPDILQTEALERQVRDVVWLCEGDTPLHVYFRYRKAGELPAEDTEPDPLSESQL